MAWPTTPSVMQTGEQSTKLGNLQTLQTYVGPQQTTATGSSAPPTVTHQLFPKGKS